jgi:hypothetical protein
MNGRGGEVKIKILLAPEFNEAKGKKNISPSLQSKWSIFVPFNL